MVKKAIKPKQTSFPKPSVSLSAHQLIKLNHGEHHSTASP